MNRKHIAMNNRTIGGFALLAMILLVPFWAWGQQTDYSGIYFIGGPGYSSATTENRFYLCPTEPNSDWNYYYLSPDQFTDDSTGSVFMTTYKCRDGVYDMKNAGWIVKKHPTENSYYIIHAIDGRYLTLSGRMTNKTANGNYVVSENRMRLHIEEIDAPIPGDSALFTFQNSPGNETTISAKGATNAYKYLNVNKNNQNTLVGAGTATNMIENGVYLGGIIGVYSNPSEGTSKWYLEKAAIDPPTITNNFNGTITITSDVAGATIYYTTDGTTPTEETTTLGITPVTVTLTEEMQVIKAIAKGASDYFPSFVATYELPVCERPVISVSGNTATFTCSTSNATIYYTLNGDPATPSSPLSTTSGVPVNIGSATAIRAIATSPGYYQSAEAFYYPEVVVHNSNAIDNMNGNYILADDFTSTGSVGTVANPFKGSIDGKYKAFALSGHALIGVAEDATIKNIVVSNVSYSGSGDVGAIVNTAKGITKIYNCGVRAGSVSGDANTGGLVGHIEAGSSVRVVNCYNFANVSGGTYAAGIVGYNEGTVASDGTVGKVRIALCMMYGNVTDATNISPVYGGNHVDNVAKFTEYNYWRYRSGLQYTALNDQLPVENDEYLSRFPFFRHILNTHRELAAFFLFGGVSCNDMAEIAGDDIAEIGHWALKKDVAAYPIIEPWPTNTHTTPTATNNNLPSTTADYAGKLLTSMGTDGYLSVSVKIGTHSYSVSLPITDMDTLNYDFTWGKVVLPFANEFEVNTDDTKICTGWKITSITGGDEGAFANYNVSDRNCTTKDLYSTTGFIFAQGGNYIVPYGVTAIEITANFAKAYYLCDATYEIVYSGNATGGSGAGYTGRAGRAGATPTDYRGQPVYNTMNEALGAIKVALGSTTPSGSVHDHAVVLIGNYHWDGEDIKGDTLWKCGCTIMSIDADNNQEPDYALYSNHTANRPHVPPTRYDFLAMIPLGMSSYLHGRVFYPNVPIWKPHGWFEITETSFTRASQFEIESSNFNSSSNDPNNYRCIINGGYFTQMVRSFGTTCRKLKYYQIGGKAYVKEFYPGNHSKRNYANTLVPVNITGGEIEQCFMTGYGLGTAYGPDIYFWCAGGKIHKFLAAYMEKPRQASNSDGNVNLTAVIDHARIYRFFGGGTTSNARITGDINVTINNSFVDFYCGGPEFGDMETGENGKTITTTADHTTFREYYGAGFGGTAITYTNDEDSTMVFNTAGASAIIANGLGYPPAYFSKDYLNQASDVGRLDYKNHYGIGNCYKYEYIMHSRGHATVARFYTGYASFSLAKAGSVTNILTNCTVERSFYGGGCQGTVDGTVTSTLTDCTIGGSAFGGGYKAVSNQVEVYSETQTDPLSTYYGESSVFSDFGPIPPSSETYTWEQGTPGQSNTADETTKKLYTGTDVTLTDLGNVTGDIKITLNGTTTVMGNVFGGGNESKSLSNTEVKILDKTKVLGNIYGGGNMGVVNGSTKVIVNGSVIE